MRAVHLTLLPIPVLAAVVAFAACSRQRDEPAVHVIPPPAPYVAPVALVGPGAAPPAAEVPPSAEDVREFERAVPK